MKRRPIFAGRAATIVGFLALSSIVIVINGLTTKDSDLLVLESAELPKNKVLQSELSDTHKTVEPPSDITIKQRFAKEKLIPEDKLDSLGIDLTTYDDEEILALRKFFSNTHVYDDELPMQFRIYVRFLLQESLIREDKRNTYFADEQSATALDAYIPDIDHWKSIASSGDVAANFVLGEFYSSVGHHVTAEKYLQKVLINVTDKTPPLERLITNSSWYDKKQTAVYLYYAEDNNIHITKNSHADTFVKLKEKYAREDIREELQKLTQTISDLEVNFQQTEPTDLNKIFISTH